MREYNVGAVYINDNVYAGETNIPLLKGNQGYSISRVVKTSGTGTPGSYDTYTIYINTDPESIVGTFQVWNGTGNIGDMTKAEYDTDNDGIVDNAEKVNNHTVDIDVPSNAKFTDTVYDDTAITNRVTTLENAGYITKSVSDLVNYYTKTETYTKQEVNTLVDTIPKFSIEVVNSLPVTDISTTTIYLVRDDSSTGDIYKEYIYVNNAWEILGTQRVDLSNYYNKTETNTLLNAKQDTLVSGTNIKTINNTSLVGSGNISIAGNEVAISDTQPTDTDNELWIDTAGTMPYVNSEIAIGSSNPTNQRVWFKQSKNLFIPTLYNNDTPIQVVNGTVSLNGDEFTLTATGSDMYFGQVVSSGTAYTPNSGILIPVQPGEKYYYLLTGTQFVNNLITSYDANKISKGYTNIVGNSTIYTVPNDVYYVSLRFGYNNATTGTDYKTKVLFAKSDTAIDYEPYVTPSINVDDEEIYSKPDEIFSNNTGVTLDLTNNRTFNLAKNSLDYKYIEIVYSVGNIMASTGKIPCINQGQILFNVLFLATTDTIQQRTLVVRNDGTSLYLVRASYINAQVGGGFSVNTNSGSCSIHRVILYN